MKAIALLWFLIPYATYAQCSGTEPWDVKTLEDNPPLTEPVQMTIHAVRQPDEFSPWRVKSPRQPSEMKEVIISGMLINCGVEPDSDFHLVIADKNGETIIAEIPKPECGNPNYASNFQQARDWIISQIGTYPKKIACTRPLKNPIPITVTGFPFYDKPKHNGCGHACNEYEVHPILKIE